MSIRPWISGFLVVVGLAATARAQRLEVAAGTPVKIELLHVEATIEEGVAKVEVDETFRNGSCTAQEGVYRFQLPEEAVIGSFSMWMDGKEKHGCVMEAAKARAVYDTIVRKQKDPGLLEQIGWREFRVNVFPIPARDTVRVKLTYSHVVRDDLGLQTLEVPLPQGCGTIGDLAIHVIVRAAHGLTGIDCPSHGDAKLRFDDAGAEATWSGDGVAPAGPFVLRSILRRTGFDITLLAQHDAASAGGWFVARVVPCLAAPPQIARDLVFVIDRSGSMEGRKMEQARAALLAGLATLKPCDRFEVISFANDVTTIGDGPLLAATPSNLERARRAAREISASGGTNIHEALVAARRTTTAAPARDRFSAVVFLTDGQPTVGETDPDHILNAWRKQCGATRLFAFGVGNDVKDFLLTKLAVEGRGDARYVREEANLEVPLAALFERVRTPLLLDPVLDVEGDGITVTDREPRRLPDLFQGRALVVSGRFTGAGKVVMHLRGRSGGDDVVVDVPVEFPRATPERRHVAQIWAKARVERLLDDLRALGPNGEMQDEIRTLGLAHQLVTPYTSFLVVEGETRLADSRNDPANGGGAQEAEEGTALNAVPPSLGGGGDITPPASPVGPTSSGSGYLRGRSPGPVTGAVPTDPTGGNGGGVRPTSGGGVGGRKGGGEGFERWEFWWEHNKEPFLDLKTPVVKGSVRDAAGGGPRRIVTTIDTLGPNRPSRNEVKEQIVPALVAALGDPNPDVVDSAALAIGRMLHAEEGSSVLAELTATLSHTEKTAREAAALSMGVLGSVDAVETLLHLMKDDPEGRTLTHPADGVEDLVRAFAAASLGLIGSPAAIDALMEVVSDPGLATQRDVQALAILALGMMKARHEEIVPFLVGVMVDRSYDTYVRAQAPIALGRLNRQTEAGSPAAREVLESTILPLFQDDQVDNTLRRSLAICIGMLGRVDDSPAIEALLNAVAKCSDNQTRHFSIMALAEIGSRDALPAQHAAVHTQLREFFLHELTQPKKIAHQPFGALGLAIYSRNRALPPEATTEAATKLLEEFISTSNPSYQGAMAIGLGLLDYQPAAEELWKKFADTNEQWLKGHIAIALGLMRVTSKAEALRGLIHRKGLDSKLRLQLARSLGLMGDRQAVPTLIDFMQSAETLIESTSAVQAIGLIGDRSAIAPLLGILADQSKQPLQRGLAAAALGLIAEKTSLPWNATFSVDANYRAKVPALAELLDLL